MESDLNRDKRYLGVQYYTNLHTSCDASKNIYASSCAYIFKSVTYMFHTLSIGHILFQPFDQTISSLSFPDFLQHETTLLSLSDSVNARNSIKTANDCSFVRSDELHQLQATPRNRARPLKCSYLCNEMYSFRFCISFTIWYAVL